MANESITFLCPACGIKLTLPWHLAGVVGQCPSCRTQIQAPSPAPAVAQSPPPAAPPYAPQEQLVPTAVAQPASPVYQPLPQSVTPAYQPSPDSSGGDASQQCQQPQPATPASYPPAPLPEVRGEQLPDYPPLLPQQEEPQHATRSEYRPEPRQLPSRIIQSEPVAKQMPPPHYTSDGTSRSSQSRPRHSRKRGRFARFRMFLLFLIAAVALVFGVLTALKNPEKEGAGKDTTFKTSINTIQPQEAPPATLEEQSIPTLPVPKPEQPSIVSSPPVTTESAESQTPQQAAMEVLEKFIKARTLAERLPLMETQTSEAELAKSCLASPLPAASDAALEVIETNTTEKVVDYYHNVTFGSETSAGTLQTVLVRKRGAGEFKVVADPFLDSYGGRLAAYAKTPSDKSGYFQVIVSVLAACYDEKVPDREKKMTLKLLPQDNAKEIAQAYFGKQSKIAQMLEDGTRDLSYGKAKACTIMLRWNTEDRPETPYLEAIDIKTLDWNP